MTLVCQNPACMKARANSVGVKIRCMPGREISHVHAFTQFKSRVDPQHKCDALALTSLSVHRCSLAVLAKTDVIHILLCMRSLQWASSRGCGGGAGDGDGSSKRPRRRALTVESRSVTNLGTDTTFDEFPWTSSRIVSKFPLSLATMDSSSPFLFSFAYSDRHPTNTHTHWATAPLRYGRR